MWETNGQLEKNSRNSFQNYLFRSFMEKKQMFCSGVVEKIITFAAYLSQIQYSFFNIIPFFPVYEHTFGL